MLEIVCSTVATGITYPYSPCCFGFFVHSITIMEESLSPLGHGTFQNHESNHLSNGLIYILPLNPIKTEKCGSTEVK